MSAFAQGLPHNRHLDDRGLRSGPSGVRPRALLPASRIRRSRLPRCLVSQGAVTAQTVAAVVASGVRICIKDPRILGKLGAFLLLQQRFLPKAWKALRRLRRRLGSQRITIVNPAEVEAVQDSLDPNGCLGRDVEVAGRTLVAGTAVLSNMDKELASEGPTTLRIKGPSTRRSTRSMTVLRTVGGLIALGEKPLVLWGWSNLISEAAVQLVRRMLLQTGSGKMWMPMLETNFQKLSVIITLTALAWYAHRLAKWWRDLRSRGKAEISDVMGWQSSLKEAQVNALTTSLQVVVWTLYVCSAMWAAGINLGRVLLFPSITAVIIGWIGREIVANIISGVVLHLTQPFAQGDWISLEGHVDGWVQDVGMFYTRVIQWDKRPMYIPNSKLMNMNVQNNSRMTHRRILYDLKIRIRDIPKIPQIVQEMQQMIYDHEDIDTVQHRLVRWREVGEFSANIWVSCYSKPTVEGIRLGPWTAVQQSVLERCSAIIYKHGAQFANLTERITVADPGAEKSGDKNIGTMLTDKLFETFSSAREMQLESREQVLRNREREVKERERDLESMILAQAEREEQITAAAEKYRRLMAKASWADRKDVPQLDEPAHTVAVAVDRAEEGTVAATAEEASSSAEVELPRRSEDSGGPAPVSSDNAATEEEARVDSPEKLPGHEGRAELEVGQRPAQNESDEMRTPEKKRIPIKEMGD